MSYNTIVRNIQLTLIFTHAISFTTKKTCTENKCCPRVNNFTT